jgi:formylglycine-generating enzyme required for sulfatase activity
MKRFVQISIGLLFLTLPLSAQLSTLHISGEVEQLETTIPEVRDINGRICAAIVVVADLEGFTYDSYNGVVKLIDRRGKDLVFLQPDERVLQIYRSGYEPFKMILSETGIRLQSGEGWRIHLAAEKKINQIPVVFDIFPDSVSVNIDETDYGQGKVFMLNHGKHFVHLSKAGYVTLQDSIVIDKEHDQFSFVLAPETDMVLVEGGAFQMGQPDPDIFKTGFSADEQPVHRVVIDDFYLSKYEVTYRFWDAFCLDTDRLIPDRPSSESAEYPVEYITWYDAIGFCNWLSRKHGFDSYYIIDKSRKDVNNQADKDPFKWTISRSRNANGYRLPTEAEWEYAARGGNLSKGYQYSGSDSAGAVAWIKSFLSCYPVGAKQPNELGLYDMSGNVWEWCWDWYDANYYRQSPVDNPRGPTLGQYRVLRSGECSLLKFFSRTAHRHYGLPASKAGLRVARHIP